ncbi:hypothetical protein HR45_05795 [Shewanella mangrovi]|uniref:Rhodanese domain-containing protein n=1 Tax=Shewanella mangrovi TaxID=1515746 RepID=A0A094JFL3_9GAMM|nr:rhodanese-like domain-containing protein [Shewanella mangrovi]KFZ38022.1 hypothetical protein HR45_05795 [Shewanella mangrovi]
MMRTTLYRTLYAIGLASLLLGWQLPALAKSDITPAAAVKLVNHGAMLIDVRTVAEFNDGHIIGAQNMEYQTIVQQLATLDVAKAHPIVLYCRSGRRASIAQQALQQAGYSAVANAGGYGELKAPFAAKTK